MLTFMSLPQVTTGLTSFLYIFSFFSNNHCIFVLQFIIISDFCNTNDFVSQQFICAQYAPYLYLVINYVLYHVFISRRVYVPFIIYYVGSYLNLVGHVISTIIIEYMMCPHVTYDVVFRGTERLRRNTTES